MSPEYYRTLLNMEFWTNVYIEFFGGLITSALFLVMLSLLRPRVKISPHIAKFDDRGTTRYLIKFYNRSPWTKIFDVKMELHLCKPIGAPGGQNLKMTSLNLRDNEIWYLSSWENTTFKKKWKRKLRLAYASYAKIVSIEHEGFEEQWKKDNSMYLSFKVSARHGFSGVHKVFKEEYNDPDTVVKDGKFRLGNTFKIEPVNNTEN